MTVPTGSRKVMAALARGLFGALLPLALGATAAPVTVRDDAGQARPR
jgi:hypothetical protein